MDGNEHRAIGDAAFGASLVNLGGDSPTERFLLSYGDVMALSGDFFEPGLRRTDQYAPPNPDGASASDLFSIAWVPGRDGAKLGTRDEIVCALKVIAVDEEVADHRFEPGGEFAGYTFSRLVASSTVERRVRDRYLLLAATNSRHFVAPGGGTRESPAAPSALEAYRQYHEVALEEACLVGRTRGQLSRAMAREAAAQHFLTDACTAGHLRTPVAQIRAFWHARYPAFWENLQLEVASSTAWIMRERSRAIRLLPAAFLYDSTLAALHTRTSRYPQLSVGDFLARVFHDWDNTHGLTINSGGVVYGDGHIDQGVTRDLALAAARAGINDVDAAFELGAAGRHLTGQPLYRAVRDVTGAPNGRYVAETKTPTVSPRNPGQNWRAPDLESLWDTPIVGTTGTTVGEALIEMMHPDGYFIRQLDRLGQGLAEAHGLLAAPLLGAWLAGQAGQAYHHGFVEPLATNPKRLILAVAHDTGGATTSPLAFEPAPRRAPIDQAGGPACKRTDAEGAKQGNAVHETAGDTDRRGARWLA